MSKLQLFLWTICIITCIIGLFCISSFGIEMLIYGYNEIAVADNIVSEMGPTIKFTLPNNNLEDDKWYACVRIGHYKKIGKNYSGYLCENGQIMEQVLYATGFYYHKSVVIFKEKYLSCSISDKICHQEFFNGIEIITVPKRLIYFDKRNPNETASEYNQQARYYFNGSINSFIGHTVCFFVYLLVCIAIRITIETYCIIILPSNIPYKLKNIIQYTSTWNKIKNIVTIVTYIIFIFIVFHLTKNVLKFRDSEILLNSIYK